MNLLFENRYYSLALGDASALIYLPAQSNERIELTWPQFEIEGQPSGRPQNMVKTGENALNAHITELSAEGELECGAKLRVELRVCKDTPIVRFRYILFSDAPMCLTKHNGENLIYFTYPSPSSSERTEIRFSNYDQLLHGYCMNEIPGFQYEEELMGPMLTEQRGDVCMLTAYEHGSMYPDKFVVFTNTQGNIMLKALRGNYWTKQSICTRPYDTIWLQIGAIKGTQDDLARAYRDFQLNYCTLNSESRKPYIFYNSWCYQERNKFRNKTTYLSSMKQERMEEEIEIAHRMGVDVFVIDTGWYQKTGDWETNVHFFPDGLQKIHQRLDEYGMKLGLWFNPTVAAKTSRILKKNPEAIASLDGKMPESFPVWETEESYPMCLVSDYWEDFADELIRLADTVGVRYFKWDGIGMYGCNCGHHLHGGLDSTPEENHDCYAFRLVQYMSKVIDKLCSVHPDAIVDFDITEGERSVGLAFLSSGKYFSINNGPYYNCYDIDVPEDVWSNIFVHPGAARTWICRQNLSYDKWVPSILMLTHYLPDDPEDSQMVNLASLILGQNGFWGDLPQISEKGISLIRSVLDVYKRVRNDITAAYPLVMGRPGELLEVHEKINGKNGRGVVTLFANHKGSYRYRLQNSTLAEKITIFGKATLTQKDGCAYLNASFDEKGVAILFFES